jgi:hypothetical protein
MPSLGTELLAQMLNKKLLVKDRIEAPEKFTDEEIGIIKSYHPTDIDFDTHGMPQEAFWYISLDRIAGYFCNIRFGKRYMPVQKLYSWYVYLDGFGASGKFDMEETSTPADLPLDIEEGVTLLKKYLDKYQVMEQKKIETILPSEEEKIRYKREVDNLHKIATRAWNFLHEASQEFKFEEITNQLTEMDKKFPAKASEIVKMKRKMDRVKNARMQFEDTYYEFKNEVARFLK